MIKINKSNVFRLMFSIGWMVLSLLIGWNYFGDLVLGNVFYLIINFFISLIIISLVDKFYFKYSFKAIVNNLLRTIFLTIITYILFVLYNMIVYKR